MKRFFRRVLKVDFMTTKYNRPGEGTNRFVLECGHETFAKASQGTPKRKHCRDCAYEPRHS